ncbi:hypothetical protein SAMN05192583_2427 [Sphingomonas gellani]|uniref:AB hydrolase-1 domain-containing protein n=2 Tax=Sphingomonas gellani TaxID=1166340 RepID=A0A1H8F5P0_9SPHN|nr:hypothetical protein SAMN05192583_2427 [Sphingomonas gellani]
MATVPAAGQLIHDRVYPAPHDPLSVAGLPGATIDHVTTADGLTLSGVEVAGRADKPMLLIFHGNASGADDAARWLSPLLNRGYGMIAAEYRGYSGNPGRPDEAGLSADADAFYAHALAIANGRPVIVIGHSLGSGVAFALARRQRLRALVTIGAFTRLRDMTPRIARAFVGEKYDNRASIAELDEPLFLIHGTDDEVVPVAQGNQLYRAAIAAGRKGGVFVVQGGDHHPNATKLAGIIDAVVGGSEGRPLGALPEGVTFYPFSAPQPR